MSDLIRQFARMFGTGGPAPQMNRRDFLKRAGGVAAAAALPGKAPDAPAVPDAPPAAVPLGDEFLPGFELPGGWRLNAEMVDAQDPHAMAVTPGARGVTSFRIGPANPHDLDGSEWVSDYSPAGVDPYSGDHPWSFFESMTHQQADQMRDMIEAARRAIPQKMQPGLDYAYNHATGQWHPKTTRYDAGPYRSGDEGQWHSPKDSFWSSEGVVPRDAIESYSSTYGIDPEDIPEMASRSYDHMPTTRGGFDSEIRPFMGEFERVKREQFLDALKSKDRDRMNRDDFRRQLDASGLAPGGRADQQPVMDIDPEPWQRGGLPQRWGDRLQEIPFERKHNSNRAKSWMGAALLGDTGSQQA